MEVHERAKGVDFRLAVAVVPCDATRDGRWPAPSGTKSLGKVAPIERAKLD
jgi:hypothetical protein